MPHLTWDPATTPAALAAALTELAAEYPLRAGGAGLAVRFTQVAGDGCTVTRSGDVAEIRYGRTHLALRAVGSLLADLVGTGASITESCPFERLGIMLDCSRNAVMKPSHVIGWFRRLALMGYNQAMLYTEDTFEIPGQPRFGYLRGRYTQAELRELDATASRLGIELIGCIQTLAHHEQIMRWPEYGALTDFGSTMLVGEDKVYAQIEAMLDAMGSGLKSRRIHIGMDEAWHLGRGAWLDRHGATRKFDIFNQHLAKVMELVRARGLEPMIWGDMYFAMGSKTHAYYDKDAVIPADVVAAIPKDVRLTYWDYYHNDPAFYTDYIAKHRAMGFEPAMASGVWTWGQLWHNRANTEANAGACISACREANLKELFFTLWGDDLACCDFDSALAGLAWSAERCCSPASGDTRLEARFHAICAASYADTQLPSELTDVGWTTNAALWDDPILGIFTNEGLPTDFRKWSDLIARWEGLAARLATRPMNTAAGDLGHARLLAEVMAAKARLRQDLVAAYDARDRAALIRVRDAALALAPRFQELMLSWRRGWMRRNKPQGFEPIQIRMAQQETRHRELALRLDEMLSGTATGIPELDERMREAKGMSGGWTFLASGSVSI